MTLFRLEVDCAFLALHREMRTQKKKVVRLDSFLRPTKINISHLLMGRHQ